MNGLEIKLGRAVFRNPVFGVSGCTGHGYELADYADLSRFGCISLKTITYLPRPGNRPQRVHEVSAGLISSIGLQNPGPDAFLAEVMPQVAAALEPNQIAVSVAGDTIDEYVELCVRTAQAFGDRIAALELNGACPNVSHGASYFSRDPKAAFELISAAKNAVDIPIFFKFNTNYENYLEVACAIDEAGPDALYVSSTPIGMKIDINRRRPALGNVFGPICGPAIRPIGVLRVWHLYDAVKTPIIASGGAACWEDVVEYMMAGASAVGVGAAQFPRPDLIPAIVSELESYAAREKLGSLSCLVGTAHR